MSKLTIKDTSKEIQEMTKIAEKMGFELRPTIRKGEVWLEKDKRITIRLADVTEYNFMLKAGHVQMDNLYEKDYKKFKEKVKQKLKST